MNLKKSTLLATALAAIGLLASCLDGENDQHSAYAYFTVTGNNSSGYVLYQDGGGKIIPTMQSVSDLTNGKGLEKVERALLQFTYQEKDVTDNTITGAVLTGGESVTPFNPVVRQMAESQKILSADSIFNIGSVSSVWAYRGYLNIVYNGYYGWNEKKDGYLYPTTNLVYEMDQQIPNELNLTFCHNERRSKSVNPAGQMTFTSCFRLNQLQNLAPGNDSVTVKISAAGLSSPIKFKVAREDFNKGNWR